MKSIISSKTEKNLIKAFSGECQAKILYTRFGDIAKQEGYIQVEKIFKQIADQEEQHALKLFSYLEGNVVEIVSTTTTGKVGKNTLENLYGASKTESEEGEKGYMYLSQIASDEGFDEIAVVFKNLAKAEANHSEKLGVLAKKLQEGAFEAKQDIAWECINCGFVLTSKSAPKKCPVCDKDQAYFMIKQQM